MHPQEQSAFTTKTQVVWLRFFQVVWLRFFGHSHFYEVSFLHYTRSDFLAAGSFLEVPFFFTLFGANLWDTVSLMRAFLLALFGSVFWATVSFLKCHFILHLFRSDFLGHSQF